MDTKEKSGQSDVEDIEESVLQESLTDDEDSENDGACSFIEETTKYESESRNYTQALGYNEGASSRDVSEGEVELKDLKVREICEEIENTQRLSIEVKCIKHPRDNKHCSTRSSENVNDGLESLPTKNVIDVSTRRASPSSSSTSTKLSGSQTKSSEPIAIPSTSKDSSGLSPASESSPKRPTNFGRNLKQAIHVFHPTNPKTILQKVPIPIHSGRWVYLRDSPESSDYGGSPDSLDDPFLMEALYVKTPESENEDLFTPRNEEMPSCPPPIHNPVLGSPTDELAEIVGGLECSPGHSKKTLGNVPPDHMKQNINDYSYELDPIEGIAEDKPLDIEGLPCANDHTDRTFESKLSDLSSMKTAIRDPLSETVTTELKHESSRISRTKRDATFELGINLEDADGDQLFGSLRMQKVSEDLHSESNDIQIKEYNKPSESFLTVEKAEENLSEDLAPELSYSESNTVIEYRRKEGSLAHEVHSSEETTVEHFEDTQLELNEANNSPEKQIADNRKLKKHP